MTWKWTRPGSSMVVAGVLLLLGSLFPLTTASGADLAAVDKLIEQAHFAEAEQAARDLLANAESQAEPDTVELGHVLDRLVHALWQDGKAAQDETLALAERAVALKRRIYPPDDVEISDSLNGLAIVHARAGRFDQASGLFREVLRIREAALGPTHLAVAAAAENLGQCLEYLGDFDDAIALRKRALTIREELLGPDHLLVAQTLFGLATALHEFGDYAGALELYRRGFDIDAKVRTTEPEPLVARNDYANLVGDMGDFAEACRIHEQTLAAREKLLGPEHLDVVQSLTNLGEWLIEMGDDATAKIRLERAVAILEETDGPQSHWLSFPLPALGDLYRRAGDYESARTYYERTIAILEQASASPLLARTLDRLGMVMASTGDRSAARALHERALAMTRDIQGPDYPQAAVSAELLAELLDERGDVAGARSYAEEALRIRLKSLGADHPLVGTSLALLARLDWESGDRSAALDHALRAEAVTREHLRLTLRALSERQAMRYLQASTTDALGLVLSVAVSDTSSATAAAGFDAVVRSRALVLDEMAMRHRVSVAVQDSDVARLCDELAAARTRLANLTVRPLSDRPPDVYRKLLDEARVASERAERALAERSSAFRGEQARSRAGLLEVSRRLPPHSALVAYAEYQRYVAGRAATTSRKDSASRPSSTLPVRSYLAFVAEPGASSPFVVPIGRAAEIDSIIARWKEEASTGPFVSGRSEDDALAAYRRVGVALRTKIWDPVAPLVAGARLVLVVPDGQLHQLNFASLPVRDHDFLVEQGPLIHYLSSERDLVADDHELALGHGLLALGGVDFDAANPTVASVAPTTSGLTPLSPIGQTDDATMLRSASEPFRGQRSTCVSFADLHFESLPASGQETDEIVSLYQSSAVGTARGEPVAYLRGAAANEAAFKRLAPGRRVLHLATHGFFLGDRCESVLPSVRGIGGLTQSELEPMPPPTGENPLLLSGLALAGANLRATTPPDQDDGILTAEEIASLDLSGVEWAVLSACDTGAGEIMIGEGVLGLRRAFQIAGARTMILSLWSVEDESARAWMQAAYASRFERGASSAQAARDASLAVLQARRRSGKSAHPFYWAGFVAAGDWR